MIGPQVADLDRLGQIGSLMGPSLISPQSRLTGVMTIGLPATTPLMIHLFIRFLCSCLLAV